MSKKLIVGIVTGVALVSVTALLLSKNSRFNWKSIGASAGNILDGIRNKISHSETVDNEPLGLSHDGKHLAKKARHKAEQLFASQQ